MKNDLISRSAAKELRDQVIRGERPDIKSESDLLDAVPTVDAVDRQKLIGVLFPLGVPLVREDWNYSINAKAVYEAIMRTED